MKDNIKTLVIGGALGALIMLPLRTEAAAYFLDGDDQASPAFWSNEASDITSAIGVDNNNMLGPQKVSRLQVKLSEALVADGSNVIKVAGIGDSLTWHSMSHVIDRLVDEYGLTRGYGGGDGFNSFGVAYTLEGSAAYNIKTRYEISPSGNVFSLNQATGDAVRFFPGTGGLFSNIDVLDIYYVAENGAGTFDVELSTTSTSSGFVKQGATIDANNSGTATLTRLQLAPTQADYAVRIEAQSGSVDIAFMVAYDSTSDTIVLYDFGENSATPNSLATVTDATWTTFLAEDFDFIWSSYADSAAESETGIDELSAAITLADVDPDVLVISPYPQSGTDVNLIASAIRSKIITDNLGWAFFDPGHVFGTWNYLDSIGQGNDGIHPTTVISRLTANLLYHGFDLSNELGSAASSSVASGRTYPNGIEITATQTQIDTGMSFAGGRGLTARVVAKMPTNTPAAARALIGQADLTSNERAFSLVQATDGALSYMVSADGSNSNFEVVGTDAAVDLTYPREIVAVFNNGGQSIYIDGALVPTSRVTAAGTVTSLHASTETLRLGQGSTTGTTNFMISGTLYAATLLNKGLSASEVLERYNSQAWTPFADRWGVPTLLTSGTLQTGSVYRIDSFQTGDDFSNVGAASNADNVIFTATGTTPTTWSNGSTLQKIGVIFDLDMQLAGPNETFVRDRASQFNGTLSGSQQLALNVVPPAPAPILSGDTVSLTVDDQVITLSKSVITLSSDNATAANRTFTFTGATTGSTYSLIWSGSNQGQLIDTGTYLLAGNWEPDSSGDNITLYFDGTNLIEINRTMM